jgi:hypothetical protein
MSSLGDLGRFFENSLMHCLAETTFESFVIFY